MRPFFWSVLRPGRRLPGSRALWIGAGLIVAGAVVLSPGKDSAPVFDAVVVTGPREGAFFSCSCGRDRRGGMSQLAARLPARTLWVEIGDPYGGERAFVRRFLEQRAHAFRVAGESAAVEEVRLSDGSEVLLIFAEQVPPEEIVRLVREKRPLILVGERLREDLLRLLGDARGIYAVSDRPRRESGTGLRVLGFEGREGRQALLIRAPLLAEVLDLSPLPGHPPDPMDVEWLDQRHRRAGVLAPSGGAPAAGARASPERCGECHPSTLARWRGSRHARALEELPAEGGRTCYGCHSVLREKPPARVAENAVTCGSCHGDASGHPEAGRSLPAADCAGCHTRTASPRFERSAYWERIRCGG